MLSHKRKKEIISLKQKKFRQKYSQFLVEGEKSVCELYSSNFEISEILATMQFIENNKTQIDTSKILIISEKEMNSISLFDTPPGIVAVSNFKDNNFLINNLNNKITLALDGISDPGNLGTIIRVADWYGIENIICSANSVDLYNPKTINSSMGSFTRVNVFYENLLEILKKSNIKKYACVMDGKPLQEIANVEELIIIIGNESNGICNEILEISDFKITIPRKGKAESLNAAIATAIVCHKFSFG